MSRPVFVYGTLTDADRVDRLLEDWRFRGAAILEGLRPVQGRYPTLAPGGRTVGRLLATTEIDRLDAYEGVNDGIYVRETVPSTDGGTVWVYIGDPERLDAPAAWPGDGSFEGRVRTCLRAEDVHVRRIATRDGL